MKFLLTGYPGWFANRFLETLKQYSSTAGSICALVNNVQVPREFDSVLTDVCEGDVLDPSSLTKATRDVDVVIHAAGVLHVKKNDDFYKINRDGTRHLIQASCDNGVKRFIYISSNAAQGFCRGRGFELDESMPCMPSSHYGRSKYEAEEIVQNYYRQGKIETVILRPAMFYGPPVAPRHLDIYRKIQRGWFPIFGSGNYLRSLTYIDNLIQGVHLAIDRPKANGQTYYITDAVVPTLSEIIQTMAGQLNPQLKVIHFPAFLTRIAEILDLAIARLNGYWMLPHLIAESCKNIACKIDKARAELGYDPKVDYVEGYRRTIAWCRERKLI